MPDDRSERNVYKVTVHVVPRGWGRARTGNGHFFVDAKTSEAKEQIAWAWRQRCPGPMIDGPVGLVVHAYFPFLKSATKKFRALGDKAMKSTKPDADNVGKLVMDALNSIAWVDDALVVNLLVYKRFSDTPRLEIEVYRLEEVTDGDSRSA